MVDALPGYKLAVSALEPLLVGLPGLLIGIDGRNGVGKTTFGRYLAWHFNVSLIEGDLFIRDESNDFAYYHEEINRIIRYRLRKPRPVILETIGLFRLLSDLNRIADFSIYCQSPAYSAGDALTSCLDKYHQEYSPQEKANLVVNLEW